MFQGCIGFHFSANCVSGQRAKSCQVVCFSCFLCFFVMMGLLTGTTTWSRNNPRTYNPTVGGHLHGLARDAAAHVQCHGPGAQSVGTLVSSSLRGHLTGVIPGPLSTFSFPALDRELYALLATSISP